MSGNINKTKVVAVTVQQPTNDQVVITYNGGQDAGLLALGIEAQVGRLRPGIRELTAALPQGLLGHERADYDRRHADLMAAGVPAGLARHVASLAALASAPDIVELAEAHRLSDAVAARTYFGVGADFGLDWLRSRIDELVIQGHWQAMARNSLRETLYDALRGLTERVLRGTRERDPARAVEAWRAKHAAAAGHARGIVEDIRAQPATADFASLSVALQALWCENLWNRTKRTSVDQLFNYNEGRVAS